MGAGWGIIGLAILFLIINALFLHWSLSLVIVGLVAAAILGYLGFAFLLSAYFALVFIYGVFRSYIVNFAVAALLLFGSLLDPKLLPNALWLGAIAGFLGLGCFEVWWEHSTYIKTKKRLQEELRRAEERRKRAENRRRNREQRGTTRRTGSKAAKWYAILGVPKTATMGQIKQAYYRLALRYHPDVNKSKDAETRMKEINEAYEKLETALEKPARASRP